jgi:hypothetical protein
MENGKNKIIHSRDLLMVSLGKFYANSSNMKKLLSIIEPKNNGRISLRLVDWFVTNYSKKKNIVINGIPNTTPFNVYVSYRSQLKAYSKQLFDPFRRRDRITFVYGDNENIETTIGQLNMFRWIIQNQIIDYIQTNIDEIENDMINVQKQNNNMRSDENIKVKMIGDKIVRRKKRNQLSKSSVKNMNLSSGQTRVVSFN